MSSNSIIDKCNSLLLDKNQIILYGPPGTGKTHYASLISNQSLKSLKSSIEDSSDWGILFINDSTWKEIKENKSEIQFKISNISHNYFSFPIPIIIYVGGMKTEYKRIAGIGICDNMNYEQKKINISDLNSFRGPDITIQGTVPELKNAFDYSENKLVYISKNDGIKILNSCNWHHISSFLTFHQSYSYEEFIEGMCPIINQNGDLSYQIKSGIFKELCQIACNILLDDLGYHNKKWKDGEDVPEFSVAEQMKIWNHAKKSPNLYQYLIIDEINRGDISRIFGEIITLLEKNNRLFNPNATVNTITLPYSRKKFGIPPNLFIIGTMNSTDRSISLIDIALRRRFGFVELMPDEGLLTQKFSLESANPLKNNEITEIYQIAFDLFVNVNNWIVKNIDRDHQIGHSFFLNLVNLDDNSHLKRNDILIKLSKIWYNDIIPLLQEYLYNSPDLLQIVVGDMFIDKKSAKIIEFTGDDFIKELKNHVKNLNKK